MHSSYGFVESVNEAESGCGFIPKRLKHKAIFLRKLPLIASTYQTVGEANSRSGKSDFV